MIYYYLLEEAPTGLLCNLLLKLNFDRKDVIRKNRKVLILYLKNLGYTHINVSN